MKDKQDEESIVEEVVDEILPGMGRLVKKLKKTSPEIERRIEETDREIKERLEKGYSPKPVIKYGYSMKTLVGEEKVEPKEKVKPKIEIVEPSVDIFDETNYIRVIAELPGVSEDDIMVNLSGRKLVIDAATKERRYHKAIELPCDVKDMKKRYKNGVLELEAVKNGS